MHALATLVYSFETKSMLSDFNVVYNNIASNTIQGGTLFLGDSDIEGWDNKVGVPGSYNLGVGGSTCSDVLGWTDRSVALLVPSRVVLVCGENDLWDSTVSATFSNFKSLVEKLAAGGVQRVVYMSTKPEPETQEIHSKYRRYDALVRDYATTKMELTMVDSYNGFLAVGNPDSLYQSDRLHLSNSGYALWNSWVVPALDDTRDCSYWLSGTASDCAPQPTPGPTPLPTPQPTPLPTTNPTQPASSGGFDWGEGCATGSGDFSQTLANSQDLATVGDIPAGKFDVYVGLGSDQDLDIVLYDLEATHTDGSDKAIVAFCAADGCNRGVLGMERTASSATYNGMTISYSGFGGVDGQAGKEFIRISGETTTNMRMMVYAYQSGSATVNYSWGASKTACCLGTAQCGGSFVVQVPFQGVSSVGIIPAGKNDIYVSLDAQNGADLDIRLYDLDDTTAFTEGQAVIAWCFEDNCNRGVLSGQNEQSETYVENTYTYSGFYNNGNPGNEWIKILGTSSRRLQLYVYGYVAGSATVTYSYMEAN